MQELINQMGILTHSSTALRSSPEEEGEDTPYPTMGDADEDEDEIDEENAVELVPDLPYENPYTDPEDDDSLELLLDGMTI